MSIFDSLLAALRDRGSRVRSSRNSQRFAVSVPARMRPSSTIGAWEAVVLDNLSLGGARVRTTMRLDAKTKVDVLLNLGVVRDIELRARVVYSRTNGYLPEYGLRFVELSYEQYQALIRYVNEREQALRSGVQTPRRSQPA